MGFGSLGMSELVVIFVIVLVAFGPRRFPEIARSMGSAMREFRRSLNQIQRELEEADPRKDIPGKEILDELRTATPGQWLDPNRTNAPVNATPGARSSPERPAPEVTGEAAGVTSGVHSLPDTPSPSDAPNDAPAADASAVPPDEGPQLPMFEIDETDPPEGEPTDDSRSG